MPEGGLGQWLLSRATTPERAEAVLGDCLEQAESRGRLWFWKSILQTSVSLSLTSECRRSWSLVPALLDSSSTQLADLLFHKQRLARLSHDAVGLHALGLDRAQNVSWRQLGAWRWLRIFWTGTAVLILYRCFPVQ